MPTPHIHYPVGEETRSVSGYFVLHKEVRLPFEGGEILYATGSGVADSSCCGFGGCNYVSVAGFVVNWHGAQNADGLWVSGVEPITDPGLQDRIAALIQDKEKISQVNFI